MTAAEKVLAQIRKGTEAIIEDRKILRIYTDKESGVQYVSTYLGGLTPRLAADGSVMCVSLKIEWDPEE